MERKWVHLLFTLAAAALLFILAKSLEWGWETWVGKPPLKIIYGVSLGVTAVVAVSLLLNQRVYNFVLEVVTELSKVSWPTSREAALATVVVVVTVIIASLLLSVFDLSGSRLLGLILGAAKS